jgi:hypothetical protein
MKLWIIQFTANMLFTIGDALWWVAEKLDSGLVYTWYTWFMLKSSEVQDRYNLSGPWGKVSDEHDHGPDCDCKEFD